MADLDLYVRNASKHWSGVYKIPIPPALVRGIIQKESSGGVFTETAESGGRKSYGPMMVLDSTAREMGVTEPARLKEPGLGIWYGTRYLGTLLARFRGDVPRAVSAYNTGPGRAVRSPSGSFPNQTYVNDVLRFAKQFQGAAVPIAGIVVLGLAAVLYLRRRRRAA